jgi:TRAP-type mannitol/chloroaromatic compound transport system permease small subunit
VPDKLLRISKAIGAFISVIASIASWLLIVMIAIIIFDVTARKVPPLQSLVIDSWLVGYVSSVKLQEWEWHLHTIVFALCLGATYVKDRHVRVGLWRDSRSPRTQAWIEIIGILFLLVPFLAVLVLYGIQFAATSYAIGEGSSAMLGLSNRWLIKGILVFGFILVMLAGVAILLKNIAYIMGAEPSGDDDSGGASGPDRVHIQT